MNIYRDFLFFLYNSTMNNFGLLEKQKQNDTDIYDVNKYTDKELLDILDLFNPTDRELEAKIIHLIRKYELINSPSADLLSQFYHDIYFRFFDGDGEDDDTGEKDIIEGFETISNSISNDISFSIPSPSIQVQNKVQLTNTLDYTKGKLNPLLKQTYKRTICIDSQYRDFKNSLSTDFTLNFTETLKDVVSLKLYAVQIPYTWYTINRNYGSNFIYLKGNSPGIDNGYYDFKITIDPGNYQQNTIANAIQTSVQNLSIQYPDVSFGNTSFNYNNISCTASFKLDIQIAYNETNYRCKFNDILYSPVPTDNINRSNHLSAYLGFNSQNYSLCALYSSRNIPFLNSNNSVYSFNSSNNIVYLIQYAPTKNSSGRINNYDISCVVYQTIPIVFPISIGALESQASIYNIVKTTISEFINTDGRIIESNMNFNQITGIDLSKNTFDNSGNYYFQWDFKLNRLKGYNIPGSKLCLRLPINETNKDNSIWIGNNSCFRFLNEYNDLNQTISETNISRSNFDVSGNFYFSFLCNNAQYNQRNVNDVSSGNILIGSFSLNNYIKNIDTKFDTIPNFFIRNYSFAEINSNSNFHMRIDIYRNFNTDNFRINNDSLLNNLLRFNISSNEVLYNDVSFNSTTEYLASFNITSGTGNDLLMTIFPDEKVRDTSVNSVSFKSGISKDVSYNIYVPNGSYSFSDLESTINNAFNRFSDNNIDSYPLQKSFIKCTRLGNGKLNWNLTINVIKQLSQKDYALHFYDSSGGYYWKQNLGIDSYYNLADYTSPGFNYADIYGNKKVVSDFIILKSDTSLLLYSLDNGVVGSGEIRIDIPKNTYSRTELFNLINEKFNENFITRGSYISFITDPTTSLEYTKIVWNINKVYTTTDYKLVFYDLYSFVSCYLGNSSIRNATWDTTLGWILGFRNLTEYSFSATNIYYSSNLSSNVYYEISSATITTNVYSIDNTSVPYRAIAVLTGDTTISVNLYNYFMVILDDYNQNHLNDGLITITPKDNNLQLPSYANRAKYICDPITNTHINTGITDIGTNNLTQNQIYSINQIVNTQNTKKGYTNSGVFVKDIFGLIPIKTTGMSPGQIFVELGGTLQNQDRVYFGPVNIHRMAIKLVNDRGDIVDLNGANWSLQFICEQLYQTASANNASS